MNLIALGLVLASVPAAIIGGGAVGTHLHRDVSVPGDTAPEPPYDVRLSGSQLQDRVVSDLRSVDAARQARRAGRSASFVVLDRVSYERSAGGVVARGSLRDLGGPRTLRVVIDAYDASGTYGGSDASVVSTSVGPTDFSASMTDRDDYASFGVRFLDGSVEVRRISPGQPMPDIPALLSDDALFPADLAEVGARLVVLGYAPAASLQGDVPMMAVVSRFRHDHGLGGPPVVSIGDLIALRAVSAGRETVDLSTY